MSHLQAAPKSPDPGADPPASLRFVYEACFPGLSSCIPYPSVAHNSHVQAVHELTGPHVPPTCSSAESFEAVLCTHPAQTQASATCAVGPVRQGGHEHKFLSSTRGQPCSVFFLIVLLRKFLTSLSYGFLTSNMSLVIKLLSMSAKKIRRGPT